MKTTIKLSDFSFTFKGSGHYKVTYESPITGKEWSRLITDMTIIDATKNTAYPKIKDLNTLKRICKTGKAY